MRITLAHLVCAGAAALLLCAGSSLAASQGTIWLTYTGDAPTRYATMNPAPSPYNSQTVFYVGQSNFHVMNPADDVIYTPITGSKTPTGLGINLYVSESPEGPHYGDWTVQGYCIDTRQIINNGRVDEWEIRPLAEAPMGGTGGQMGAAKAGDLARLFHSYFNTVGSDADKAAAFGASVWEIVNETSGSYSLSGGSFTVTPNGYGGAPTGWGATANGWLAILGTVQESDLWAIVNTSTQDFAIMIPGTTGNGQQPVPEPLTLGMGFLAVAGMGLYIRRHTKTATA